MKEEEFNKLTNELLNGEDQHLIDQFTDYWTEKGLTAKKMRFEKERVFDIKRRFATWKRNAERFNKPINGKPCPIQGTLNAYEQAKNILNGNSNI